jgi:hypothetical protein
VQVFTGGLSSFTLFNLAASYLKHACASGVRGMRAVDGGASTSEHAARADAPLIDPYFVGQFGPAVPLWHAQVEAEGVLLPTQIAFVAKVTHSHRVTDFYWPGKRCPGLHQICRSCMFVVCSAMKYADPMM